MPFGHFRLILHLLKLKASELRQGQSGRITAVQEGYLSNKLMEMGCIPGTRIFVEFFAPGGDPVALNIDGYVLGLRRSEAVLIEVETDFDE